jgi:serine-type D-Ala-D-Ala carboxypeptidase (penicillin-binding protein 5/6)
LPKFVSLIIIMFLIFSCQLNTSAAENQEVEIKSEAAVLLDAETGAVLFAKNSAKKLYPASLTKIATAIYAIENGNLDDIVMVSANAVKEEGTRVYLEEGEQVPLKKLIQGMLINSGNDAAVAIAEHLDGNVETFAEKLNRYLVDRIGVKNTHFTNPNGLFNKEHYTTAMDLALITNYAKKNTVFSEIFGTKELSWEGKSWETTLLTHHRLLKGEFPIDGITGGKTGYVNESKHTLATTAERDALKLTAIVLKAKKNKDVYNDTEKLIAYGFNGFRHSILKKDKIFKNKDNEFYLLDDTVITEPVTNPIINVNKQGILTIENNKGQVIQSVELKRKEEQKQPSSIEHKQVTSQRSGINIFFGILLFAFLGIFLGVRKKIVKKS